MTDKELIELAAKAAGIELVQFYDGLHDVTDDPNKIGRTWNPLTDDGDALRLAVKLRLFESGQLWDKVIGYRFEYEGEDDPYAATRRAIVRAAAEIGRNMG